jgi:uncharacterized damage-inducible protein DinB
MTDSRVDPGMVAPERASLDEFLEYQRATLLMKCDGLGDDEMRLRSVPPSTMSLLGLVRHMTDVERHWFRNRIGGEQAPFRFWTDTHPDGDFDLVDDASVAEALADHAEECAHSRIVVARLGLDATGATHGDPRGELVSLRWVLVHMIEEYARHNGHADLLRECIDGTVGD